MNTLLKKILLPIVILLLIQEAQAQTRPDKDQNTQQSATCIACNVVSSENSYDLNTNTFSTFDVSPLLINVLGYISRDYCFPTDLPMTDEIKLEMSFDDPNIFGSLISTTANAIVFNRVEIELLDGNTVVARYGGNGLASRLTEIDIIDLNTSRFNMVIKVPTTTVDGIRIKTGALAGIGTGITPTNLNVYDITSTMTNRYYASRFTGHSGQHGASLLVCLSCGVDQENLAATYFADPNTEYATYQWALGLSLLGSEYQYIEYDWGNTPNYDLLGDQDGIPDALTFVLQEVDLIDMGLADLGINLWNSGGIEFLVTYTDLTSSIYSNNSSFLNAKSIGKGSGRFQVVFDIPQGKTVDRVEVRRVAPSIGLFTELRLYAIFSVVAGTLPLDLLSFDAQKEQQNGNEEQKTVKLHWTTAQELNVSHFEVQRSRDGIEFETIAEIKAKNQVFNSYTSTDYYPMLQDNYYRLKMVDVDLTTTYSKVRNIHFNGSDSYHLFQSSDELVLQTSVPLTEDVTILIASLDGKVLHQTIFKKGETIARINTSSFGTVFHVVLKENTPQNTGFSQLVYNR